MTQFKTETVTEILNGKSIEVTVNYFWDYCTETPDFDYGNEEENKVEMRKFESGEYINCDLRVEAVALGESGIEHLGQVFTRARMHEADLYAQAGYYSMRDSALLELRAKIQSKFEMLNKILGDS